MKTWHIIRYFLKTAWKVSPVYIMALCATSLISAVQPFIAVVFPKLILDELGGARDIAMLALLVGLTAGTALITGGALALLKRVTDVRAFDVQNAMFLHTADIMMRAEYANMEDPEFIDLRERALFSANSRTIQSTIQALPDTISAFLSMAGAVAVLVTFDAVVIGIIVLITIGNYFLQRYFQKKQIAEELRGISLNKFFNYYISFMRNRNLNKDARLYASEDFMIGKTKANDDLTYSILRDDFHYIYLNEGTSKALSALQTAFVFAWVGIKTIRMGLTIGDFSMYTGAAATFDSSLRKFFEAYLQIRRNTVLLADFIKLNETPLPAPEDDETVQLPQVLRDADSYTVAFENVSFRYPKSDKDVLCDVSFTIRPGERVSIVGRNGAGKTTIIKLLSRLYAPSAGRILLNDIDIWTIPYPAYVKLLSVVFQDFKLFEFSIFENVVLNTTNAAKEGAASALDKAGLLADVGQMPVGIDTPAGKWYDKDGVDLSGGQQQKLAIARAIYRDAPMVVLDEPTAALDPLAEAETYEKFNDVIIGRKTAVYISHRLSSSKFCDTILYIEDAQIKEHGSHAELMAKDGAYAHMFRLQQEQFA